MMDNVQRKEHANALQDTWEYIVKSVSLLSIVEYVSNRFKDVFVYVKMELVINSTIYRYWMLQLLFQ